MEKTKKPFLIAFAGIVALSMLALMPASALAKTINVPGDYSTIGEAINEALDGDTVLVGSGIYKESIQMKTGVTVQGSGADSTTIQGIQDPKVNYVVKGAPNSTISGFTITPPGNLYPSYVILNSSDSSPTITNNIIICTGFYYGIYNGTRCSPTITNNIITGSRKGIYNTNSSPTITNNIISGNAYEGIYNTNHCSPTITNNTITGNGYSTIVYSGIYNDGTSSPTITNNIISGNAKYGIESLSESPPVIEYNDVFDNKVGEYYFPVSYTPPPSNISVDPMFVDAGNGDCHLREGSPCIDSGTNAPWLSVTDPTDADGNPRIVDGDGDEEPAVDMGAFEYQVATNPSMECFEVNYMKVIDRTRYGAKRDKIKIGGSLKVAEDAEPFDSVNDVVTVTINGEEISIQPGSFKEKRFLWLHYYCFRGDIEDVRVHMHLNFNRCRWWVKIYGMEASGLVQSEVGATVELKIGEKAGNGKDSFEEWTKRWQGRTIGFARFIEWPPKPCCGQWWW